MVVLDMAVKIIPGLRVLTLDTGRLPEETYQMIETVREHYRVSVETISPDRRELEEMVESYGPNLFRQEYAARLLCCQIRKVRPLARKLTEFDAYFVGLRRTQSETRALLPQIDETSHPGKNFSLSGVVCKGSRCLYTGASGSCASPVCSRLYQHWLCPLHQSHLARRRGKSRAVVVGTGCRKRMRPPLHF